MSAFMVNDEHIHAILSHFYGMRCTIFGIGGVRYDLTMTCGMNHIGRELLRENLKSVLHCYPNHSADDHGGLPDYEFQQMPREKNPLQVLRWLGCLQYQSCEHPDFYGSDAYRLICGLRECIIPDLPGYRDMKWAVG